MTTGDFEGNPDPRKAYRVEETPTELAAKLVEGLDRIIKREGDAPGLPPKEPESSPE